FWQNWRGWPPARLLSPSECTARRGRSLAFLTAQLGGPLPPREVIPHGIYPLRMSSGDRRIGRRILDVPPRAPRVLCFDRISPEKSDYRQLVWAYHHLRQLSAAPDGLVLALVGGVAPHDRAYVEELKRLGATLSREQPIRVIEHLHDSLKPHVLAAADVL